MTLTIKILVISFVSVWAFVLGIVMGELYAMENKHPRFTRWWRKHWIGIEDELYLRKQNKK